VETILTPLREQQLVDAWRDGDADALRLLLASYQRRIFAICYRMLHHVEDAEDLAQDVLIKVYERLDTYDGRAKLSTWIIRIAMNACVSHLRKAKVRHAARLDNPVSSASRPGNPSQIHSTGESPLRSALQDTSEPSPDSSVEQAETRRVVMAALDRLDPDVRALLVLRDVQSMDYEQISQVFDVPLGTVKSRLFRARAALRAEIEQAEGHAPDQQ